MLLYKALIDQYDFEASGKDDTGLERWVVMVFRGSEGITTWVVCGYNPCKTGEKLQRSTYQQHRRYLIQTEKDTICPRNRSQDDLLRQLTR